MKSLVAVILLGLVTCVPFSAQDESKPVQRQLRTPEVIPPSTPCEGVPGAPGEFAIECEKREAVRLLIVMDKPEAAMKVLCTTKALRESFGNNAELCQRSN
jgi:hypothetical protein